MSRLQRIDRSFSKYLMLVTLFVAALPQKTWAIQIEECSTPRQVGSEKIRIGFVMATGIRSAQWFLQSTLNAPTKIRLDCWLFELPASDNCSGDRLSVSPSGDCQHMADALNFCGNMTRFEVTSTRDRMALKYTGSFNTTTHLMCDVQAIESTVPTCNCGKKKPVLQRQIFGGMEAGINEYPMMAGLVDLNKRIIFCGATIISPYHVLTAAHCNEFDLSRIGVLVGDHDISTGLDTASASLHTVSSFVSHPSYNFPSRKNDIGVITVTNTIRFTPEVGPACLPFETAFASFVGSNVDVLGWGVVNNSGVTSKTLQKVQLDVIEISRCRSWPSFVDVTSDQVCTYTPGKDTCKGDSGGPLLWQNPITKRLVLVGIISYGVQLCSSNTTSPSVNTRVGAYLNWILSVTPGVDYCRFE